MTVTKELVGTGSLVLVPTPLDFGCEAQVALTQVLPEATLARAAGLRHWICENARSARAFLKRIDGFVQLCVPLQEMEIHELPRWVHKKGDHIGSIHGARPEPWDPRPMLAPAMSGEDVGLISEAGMPAVADPGSSIVRAAHDLGLKVEPLVGPVSLLLALAASGLNGQQFAFVGYVPAESAAREQQLRLLEAHARRTGQTQIFIETPHRNAALLHSLLQVLHGETRLATASGLTMLNSQLRSASVAEWKSRNWQVDRQSPTVFAMGV